MEPGQEGLERGPGGEGQTMKIEGQWRDAAVALARVCRGLNVRCRVELVVADGGTLRIDLDGGYRYDIFETMPIEPGSKDPRFEAVRIVHYPGNRDEPDSSEEEAIGELAHKPELLVGAIVRCHVESMIDFLFIEVQGWRMEREMTRLEDL